MAGARPRGVRGNGENGTDADGKDGDGQACHLQLGHRCRNRSRISDAKEVALALSSMFSTHARTTQ